MGQLSVAVWYQYLSLVTPLIIAIVIRNHLGLSFSHYFGRVAWSCGSCVSETYRILDLQLSVCRATSMPRVMDLRTR